MPYEFITTLLDFKEFQVSDLQVGDRNGSRVVIVTIEATEGTHRCGECGKTGLPGYDSSLQDVRPLMWWQSLTIVRFKRFRVSCPNCKGVRTEALGFVDIRGPRVTKPLLGLIYELCKVMTHKSGRGSSSPCLFNFQLRTEMPMHSHSPMKFWSRFWSRFHIKNGTKLHA